MDPVPVLIFTGPVGAGKSTTMIEASRALRRANIPHGAIDIDALASCHPSPEDDPYNQQLALRNLQGIWPNFYLQGARKLILARVIETRDGLEGYEEAVPGAEITVCRIQTSMPVLFQRLGQRESPEAISWYHEHAELLAAKMLENEVGDFVISNEYRTAPEVALEALQKVGWVS